MKNAVSSETKLRLLFVKLKHIGDALLLTPALVAVREDYPAAEIWVVVRQGCEGILAGCPAIDRILTTAAPETRHRRIQDWVDDGRLIRELRRARFDYAIESDIEAGIILLGSEVKSLRQGGSNIAESYASVEGGELWLINGYIAPYVQAKTWGHDERRHRKLLVSRKEMSRLWTATAREGMTIVPLKMYFNDRGIVKLKIGIAKGKKLADKRETSAKRDWDRQKARIMKQGHQGL